MADDLYYSIRIRAGEAEYDVATTEVNSFSVEDEAGRPSTLDALLSDQHRTLAGALSEGMDVDVELGTVDDHTIVFRGFITRLESDFPEDDTPTLRLVAHDRRMRLGLRERSRAFVNKTLSEVVSSVVGQSFGRVDIRIDGDASFDENGIRQTEMTDLAFLMALAQEFDCEILLDVQGDNEILRFVSLKGLLQQKPALTMAYGRVGVHHLLLSFRPVADVSSFRLPVVQRAVDSRTAHQSDVVRRTAGALQVRDDYADEYLAEHAQADAESAESLKLLRDTIGKVQERLRNELGTVRRGIAPAFLSPDRAARLGHNAVARGLLGMRASGRLKGAFQLRPGIVVNVQAVGGRFSGHWYLSEVRHVVDGSGFHTEFVCER